MKIIKSLISAVVLTLGLFFVSCATTETPAVKPIEIAEVPAVSDEATPFEGLWKHTMWQADNATYAFVGNRWKFINYDFELSGVFTYTDTKITFIVIKDNVISGWTQTYTFNNDILWLKKENIEGALETKTQGQFKATEPDVSFMAKSSIPTKFEGAWRNPYSELNATYIFQGNQWKLMRNGVRLLLGTFEYTDTKITFYREEGNDGEFYHYIDGNWTQNYEIKDNLLTLEELKTIQLAYYGPFNKLIVLPIRNHQITD